MLEVLDDAINLRDERDAPVTLAQWLRCRRKPRGLPREPSPFEPPKAGPGRRQLHVQALRTKRQSGTGHLSPLWGPRGSCGHCKVLWNTVWLLLLHRHEPGAGCSRGCKLPRGTATRWSLQSVSLELCSQRQSGTHIHCQEQLGERAPDCSQPSGLQCQGQQKQGRVSQQLCRWFSSQLFSPGDGICKVPNSLGKQMLCFGIMAPLRSHLPELQDRKITQIHVITELSNPVQVDLLVSL